MSRVWRSRHCRSGVGMRRRYGRYTRFRLQVLSLLPRGRQRSYVRVQYRSRADPGGRLPSRGVTESCITPRSRPSPVDRIPIRPLTTGASPVQTLSAPLSPPQPPSTLSPLSSLAPSRWMRQAHPEPPVTARGELSPVQVDSSRRQSVACSWGLLFAATAEVVSRPRKTEVTCRACILPARRADCGCRGGLVPFVNRRPSEGSTDGGRLGPVSG